MADVNHSKATAKTKMYFESDKVTVVTDLPRARNSHEAPCVPEATGETTGVADSQSEKMFRNHGCLRQICLGWSVKQR